LLLFFFARFFKKFGMFGVFGHPSCLFVPSVVRSFIRPFIHSFIHSVFMILLCARHSFALGSKVAKQPVL